MKLNCEVEVEVRCHRHPGVTLQEDPSHEEDSEENIVYLWPCPYCLKDAKNKET